MKSIMPESTSRKKTAPLRQPFRANEYMKKQFNYLDSNVGLIRCICLKDEWR